MKKICIMAMLMCATALVAQNDCYSRLEAVSGKAQQAFEHAPWHDGTETQHKLVALIDNIDTIEALMRLQPESVPASVCEISLPKLEAQALVWREKGWLPTPEEEAEAQRKQAIQDFQQAVQDVASTH